MADGAAGLPGAVRGRLGRRLPHLPVQRRPCGRFALRAAAAAVDSGAAIALRHSALQHHSCVLVQNIRYFHLLKCESFAHTPERSIGNICNLILIFYMFYDEDQEI